MSIATLCRHDVRRLPSGAWCCPKCCRVGVLRDGMIEWRDDLLETDKVLDGILGDISAMASPAESKADSQCGLPAGFVDQDWDGLS